MTEIYLQLFIVQCLFGRVADVACFARQVEIMPMLGSQDMWTEQGDRPLAIPDQQPLP